MDIAELLNEIKRQTLEILSNNFKEFKPELQKDITAFLENSKQKLERWALLVADGSITSEELEWLLKSEQDLITLQALQTAGLSKIKLNNIKKTIIKTIFQVVIAGIIK
jgi:nanoRNase/pAp phosphatase (c-di-AMP/oligoRNAs hydrolase)